MEQITSLSYIPYLVSLRKTLTTKKAHKPKQTKNPNQNPKPKAKETKLTNKKPSTVKELATVCTIYNFFDLKVILILHLKSCMEHVSVKCLFH